MGLTALLLGSVNRTEVTMFMVSSRLSRAWAFSGSRAGGDMAYSASGCPCDGM